MKSENERSTKKAYHRPQLRIYGDIRELTQSAGNTGAMDSGTVTGMKKTGLP
jgi:hypothetical protein